MSKWIVILVEVLIFTSIIGVIATQITASKGNLSGASLTIFVLITLFIVIGFVMAIIKSTGIKGGR